MKLGRLNPFRAHSKNPGETTASSAPKSTNPPTTSPSKASPPVDAASTSRAERARLAQLVPGMGTDPGALPDPGSITSNKPSEYPVDDLPISFDSASSASFPHMTRTEAKEALANGRCKAHHGQIYVTYQNESGQPRIAHHGSKGMITSPLLCSVEEFFDLKNGGDGASASTGAASASASGGMATNAGALPDPDSIRSNNPLQAYPEDLPVSDEAEPELVYVDLAQFRDQLSKFEEKKQEIQQKVDEGLSRNDAEVELRGSIASNYVIRPASTYDFKTTGIFAVSIRTSSTSVSHIRMKLEGDGTLTHLDDDPTRNRGGFSSVQGLMDTLMQDWQQF